MKNDDTIEGEIEETDADSVIRRFMLGDTEDMDFHDRYYGDILRNEILRLRGEVKPAPKAVGYRESAKSAEPASTDGEYELEILSIEWSPAHDQQYVEFKVHGAPTYSYSQVKDGPILRAVVKLAVDTSRRLASGGGSALVLSDAAAAAQVFASPLGSDMTTPEGVPREPTKEQVLEACRGALKRHLVDVREENARAGVRDRQTESLVGQRMKVRT